MIPQIADIEGRDIIKNAIIDISDGYRSLIKEHFENRLPNARTEGFNNVAKLVQKRAYGYKSFENYRLRLLNACL